MSDDERVPQEDEEHVPDQLDDESAPPGRSMDPQRRLVRILHIGGAVLDWTADLSDSAGAASLAMLARGVAVGLHAIAVLTVMRRR